MNVKASILQSGFLSMNLKDAESTVGTSSAFSTYLLKKGYMKNDNPFYFSVTIKDLFDQFMANDKLLDDFDFREKILQTAFMLFNTQSMYDWVQIQTQSDYYSEIHEAFLRETFKFIFGINRRTTQVSQWISLLDTSGTRMADPKIMDDMRAVYTSEIIEVIRLWTSQEGGFQDLLVSLYVIFGSRKVSTITEG